MLPFGPFRPDVAGINTPVVREARNVLPSANGFRPLPGPASATNALPGQCVGAAVFLANDGTAQQFAGTLGNLYKLNVDDWQNVSEYDLIQLRDVDAEVLDIGDRVGDEIVDRDANIIGQRAQPGGDPTIVDRAGNDVITVNQAATYSTSAGERWNFELFGDYVIATNYTDPVQYYELGVSGTFAPLPGSPPQARYVTVIRDFLVLGAVNGAETRIQWSGLNDASVWTPGVSSSDFQDMPTGGPVRGLIGGATGYVFQQQRITRMTYVPGSEAVFQFDTVQEGKGLAASNSLTRIGDEAFFFSTDGFYRLDINGGGIRSIGAQKWREWFLADYRAGTEASIIGAADPINPYVVWAYISRDNSTLTQDRLLIYDRVLDEATFADVSASALTTWVTSDITLDTMNEYGSVDTLPYSFDSPAWKAGASAIGLFGSDNRLAFLSGSNLAATVITADGRTGPRVLIRSTRPAIDTTSTTVAVAAREREGDAVVYGTEEAMEDTGDVPAWSSGFVARARIKTTLGASWTKLQGVETVTKSRGMR